MALFTGPSGTGKTIAALLIAKRLGLDLFKADLGSLVSKYVGETEQRLDRLFDAAEVPTPCCSSMRRTRCSAAAAR